MSDAGTPVAQVHGASDSSEGQKSLPDMQESSSAGWSCAARMGPGQSAIRDPRASAKSLGKIAARQCNRSHQAEFRSNGNRTCFSHEAVAITLSHQCHAVPQGHHRNTAQLSGTVLCMQGEAKVGTPRQQARCGSLQASLLESQTVLLALGPFDGNQKCGIFLRP